MDQDIKCVHCGEDSNVMLPANHNGDFVYWECPYCQGRNIVPGNDPTERALAEAETGESIGAGIEVINDADDGRAESSEGG